MTKKSMTDKKTEWGIFQDLKKLGEVELIGGKYYLIDEEKCLYRKLNSDGIFTGSKVGKLSSGRMPDPQMITLLGPDLQ